LKSQQLTLVWGGHSVRSGNGPARTFFRTGTSPQKAQRTPRESKEENGKNVGNREPAVVSQRRPALPLALSVALRVLCGELFETAAPPRGVKKIKNRRFSRTNSPRISIIRLPTVEKCWGVRGVGVSRGPASHCACGHGPAQSAPIDRGPPSKTGRRGVEPRVNGGPGARRSRPGYHHRPLVARRSRTGVTPPAGLSPPAATATPLSVLYHRGLPTKSSVFSQDLSEVSAARVAGLGSACPITTPRRLRPRTRKLAGEEQGITMRWLGSRGRDPDTAPRATRRRGWPGRLARQGDEAEKRQRLE
jgi:hypothetical protein